MTYPDVKLLLITDGTWRIHYYTDDFHGSVAGTEDVIVAAMTCDRTGSGDAIVGGGGGGGGGEWDGRWWDFFGGVGGGGGGLMGLLLLVFGDDCIELEGVWFLVV